MSRRLPSAADVRAAIAAARRAIKLSAAPIPPSVTSVTWTLGAPGTCVFCGFEGPVVRPDSAPELALCEATLAELHAATRGPRSGAAADAVLAAVEAWAGPEREGEAPPQLPPPREACAICHRAPHLVADLAAGPEEAICGDCLAHATSAIDPGLRDDALETESHAAKLEIEDLERLVALEGPKLVRENATLALSLLRLLTAPDADRALSAKLLALVRAVA